MAITYCNTTTDLKSVFVGIEKYQHKERIKEWTNVSGTIYKKPGTGYQEVVFWEGTQLTAGTNTTPTAGQYYYDSDKDILYVNNSLDPDDDHIVEAGPDWDAFKEVCRNQAQEIVDGYMNKVYETPLRPRSTNDHVTTVYYEYPIVRATAALTCYLIISSVNPMDANADALYKIAINPDPQEEEQKGILNQYADGDLVRQDQTSPRELGKWNIKPYASNTVSVWPQFFGTYSGGIYKEWKVQIDTAGVVGTATYKVSFDGGTTFDFTLQKTFDSNGDEHRMYIADGVYVYWPVATYGLNDYWMLYLQPVNDEVEVSKAGTIRVTR